MTTQILVVDDSPVEQRRVGRLLQKNLSDVQVGYANDGNAALESISLALPDIVLTDLRMPTMNGLELVENIRARSYSVPVILMTSYGSEEIAVAALRAGAASYVPKLTLETNLASTVQSVLTLSSRQVRRRRLLSTLASAELSFVLDNDCSLIAPLIEYLQEQCSTMQLFDNMQMTRISMAIQEAISNAIYHGNLELDSELRQIDESIFYDLADQRRNAAEYVNRRVRVKATLTIQEVCLTIEDDGPGFNPDAVRDPTDDINLDRIGGRGLLLIKTMMDEVHHSSKGNAITMIKKTAPSVSLA
jgi:CheY-like chemotaxis protein/anti-sigma regulatory factor (Ser/Thr protein kinase)